MKQEISLDMAKKISRIIDDAISKNQLSFDINKMDYINGRFKDFSHDSINNKPGTIGYKVIKKDRIYFIFLVDWYSDNRYPIVVHVKGVKGVTGALFGSYTYEEKPELNPEEYLIWRYIPRKRDGKNPERKELFEKYCDNPVDIKLPKKINDVEVFLNRLIEIIEIRIKVEGTVKKYGLI